MAINGNIKMNKLILKKTGTWYLLHFCMVTTLATVVTHKVSIGATIASLELVFETALYYAHEHFWSLIKKKGK